MQIKPLSFKVTSALKPQTKISVMECTEKASPVQIELSGSEVGRAMYAGMGINFKGYLEPVDVTDKLNKRVVGQSHLELPNLKVFD